MCLQKVSGSTLLFLVLYVDNILLIRNNIPLMEDVKASLRKSFSMTDLGEASYILGIKIYRDRSKHLILLSQSTYIDKVSLLQIYFSLSRTLTVVAIKASV